jgi:uncharacterized membrane protein YbhN (UPF0104 family)
LVALALLVAGLVLSAWRWMILLRAAGVRAGFGRCAHLYFVGYFFNTLLPTSVGGDVVRAWGLRDCAPLEIIGGSILVERLLGFACLLALGITGSFAAEALAPLRAPLVGVGVVFLLAVLALLLVRWPTPDGGGGRVRRIAGRVSRLARETRAFGFHGGALSAALALSFVWQALLIVVNGVLCRGMEGKCPWASLVVLVPVVQTLAMIPISVGGIGVREIGYAEFFRVTGQDPAEGAALGLAWLGASSALALLGGALHLIRPSAGRAR